MLKVDDALLTELGIGDVPRVERELLKATFYQTLEMRVGLTLAEAMPLEKSLALHDLAEAGDESAVLEILEEAVPRYREVVQAHYDGLCEEIRLVAPRIRAEIAAHSLPLDDSSRP